MSFNLRNLAIAVVAFSFLGAIPAAAKNYDLVILNGRVMDPKSGLDASIGNKVRGAWSLGHRVEIVGCNPGVPYRSRLVSVAFR